MIHIGSFSKTVSASLRCGYIAARADWVYNLADLRIATSFSNGQLAAEIMLAILTDSGYRRHMEALKRKLAEAMKETMRKLAKLGITPWHIPQAGMFLWCKLPTGADAAAVARVCMQHGVVLAPGNTFSQSGNATHFMRFNVSQSADPKIYQALELALKSET